jgi:hypothetical protein
LAEAGGCESRLVIADHRPWSRRVRRFACPTTVLLLHKVVVKGSGDRVYEEREPSA